MANDMTHLDDVDIYDQGNPLLPHLRNLSKGSAALENPRLAKAYETMYKLMEYATKRDASDIFIAPNFPPAVKIDGKMVPLAEKPYSAAVTRDLVYSTMTERQIKEFEDVWELNYAHRATEDVRFRINAYHEQGRVGMVMRKINTEIATLDELGLPEILKKLSMSQRGLIIVVGATGSGKSTSMAAMVDYRNKRSAGHIITIEDPIEFVHRHHKSIITQREIGTDTGSWHIALKSAMRQAPNVVVVGEIRDVDSMSHALQLAQTGHLCICTLHATNANQAIERVINFYNEEQHDQIFMDLSMNLVAIVSQRLVEKKMSGGRTAIMDIMINSPAVSDLIFKGEISELKEIMIRSEAEGMQTFDQELLRLYQDGIIDFDEALRNADSPNNLRLAIKLYEEGQSPESAIKKTHNLNIL